jgi:hypothetical protein
MLVRSPSDDPALDRIEALLRRMEMCGSAEQAAFLIADDLPALVGADWAAFFTAVPQAGASERPHQILIDAALANCCVLSQGEPPTVAAIPVRSAGTAVGVILVGRAAGLCLPQLRTAALVAERAGAVAHAVALAQTA